MREGKGYLSPLHVFVLSPKLLDAFVNDALRRSSLVGFLSHEFLVWMLLCKGRKSRYSYDERILIRKGIVGGSPSALFIRAWTAILILSG